MKKFWFMTMVLALVVTGTVAAADSTEADNQATTTESSPSATVSSTTMAPVGSAGGASDEGWRFAITPIAIWGMNIEGPITYRGRTRQINASFDEISDNLSSAGGLGVEIGHGRWGLYLNGSVLDLESDVSDFTAPNGSTGDLTFEVDFTMAEAGFLWRLPTEGKSATIDLSIGARWTQVEVGLKGTSGFSFDRDENFSFTDPMVGVRVLQPIGKGFLAVVKAGGGGFGFSNNQSKMQWDLLGGIAYNFKFDGWGIGVMGGYKINQFDYQNHEDPERRALDLRSQGPIVSATVVF